MAKAFDCVSHKFLDAVLQFFNFGPVMCNWLKLLGNNRVASILLDDGGITDFFNLDRGRPQGDVISPTTFNFCVQILIFKIELDDRIEKIPITRPPPEFFIENNTINDQFNREGVLLIDNVRTRQNRVIQKEEFFHNENGGQTNKNESLADDNTTLCLLKNSCVMALMDILNKFADISGLRCNVEKSAIMPIGLTDNHELLQIANIGIPIVREVKLLGVVIRNELDNVHDIFQGILAKIVDLISFWDRFKLTLPGRLTIAKTYLLSQLGYVGCFLTCPDVLLTQMQRVINNYIKGSIPVSDTRIEDSVVNGGLGFFNIGEFLCSQKISWLIRANKYRIDNWRVDLISLAPNKDITLLRKDDIDITRHPILHGLVEAFDHFHGKFCVINGNRKVCGIFDNPMVKHDNNRINRHAFGENFYNTYKRKIRELTYDNFYEDGRHKNYDEIRTPDFPLTFNTWLRIRAAIGRAENLWKKDNDDDLIVKNVRDFFGSIFRGSKKIRLIMTLARDRQQLSQMTIVNTFCNLVGLPVQENDIISKYLSIWGNSYIQNEIRDFIFKQRNNVLRLNNRLNAMDPNIDPMCTFCRIRRQANRDGFEHFFYTCNVTTEILHSISLNLNPIFNVNSVEFRALYWFGIFDGKVDQMATFYFDTIRYILFSYKRRNIIPQTVQLKREAEFIMHVCSKLNRNFGRRLHNSKLLENLLPARG